MDNQASQVEIPKPELVAKLKGLIADAKNMPLEELCKAGDYENDSDLKYPHTKGEQIADEILSLLLFQSWADAETEPVLDEIFDLAGQLDKDINQPEIWQELFALANEIE